MLDAVITKSIAPKQDFIISDTLSVKGLVIPQQWLMSGVTGLREVPGKKLKSGNVKFPARNRNFRSKFLKYRMLNKKHKNVEYLAETEPQDRPLSPTTLQQPLFRTGISVSVRTTLQDRHLSRVPPSPAQDRHFCCSRFGPVLFSFSLGLSLFSLFFSLLFVRVVS